MHITRASSIMGVMQGEWMTYRRRLSHTVGKKYKSSSYRVHPSPCVAISKVKYTPSTCVSPSHFDSNKINIEIIIPAARLSQTSLFMSMSIIIFSLPGFPSSPSILLSHMSLTRDASVTLPFPSLPLTSPSPVTSPIPATATLNIMSSLPAICPYLYNQSHICLTCNTSFPVLYPLT